MAALAVIWEVCAKSARKSGTGGFLKLDFKETCLPRCCERKEISRLTRRQCNVTNRQQNACSVPPPDATSNVGRSWGMGRTRVWDCRSRSPILFVNWNIPAWTSARYSTNANQKVPKSDTTDVGKGSTSGNANAGANPGSTASNRLQSTKQMLKETKEKMKDRVEELIMRENIMTIPNMLCLTRIALSPVIGYLIFHNGYSLALGLFVFAGITDLLDGFIARTFKSQQSMFGSFLDPLADKLLVFTLVIALTGCNLIPVPLTALIIARDACLIGAGFYIRYVSLPPPKTMTRYFNATLATAQLQPTFVSKVNTAVQLTLVACTLASPVFEVVSQDWLHALWYITATTTVLSALSYVTRRDSYFPAKKINGDKK